MYVSVCMYVCMSVYVGVCIVGECVYMSVSVCECV